MNGQENNVVVQVLIVSRYKVKLQQIILYCLNSLTNGMRDTYKRSSASIITKILHAVVVTVA